ncbi:hypothetical protein ZHAS_00012518 [Anopheles sinensis]|uniref:Uncharacterized protein n=1 Tax=Anopheles sinensis TaxID=74873 RepID=A0A084W339_ANOSI|nr:hypothetical protein ZHAS_00012518 [Anopheles sinensis]
MVRMIRPSTVFGRNHFRALCWTTGVGGVVQTRVPCPKRPICRFGGHLLLRYETDPRRWRTGESRPRDVH